MIFLHFINRTFYENRQAVTYKYGQVCQLVCPFIRPYLHMLLVYFLRIGSYFLSCFGWIRGLVNAKNWWKKIFKEKFHLPKFIRKCRKRSENVSFCGMIKDKNSNDVQNGTLASIVNYMSSNVLVLRLWSKMPLDSWETVAKFCF